MSINFGDGSSTQQYGGAGSSGQNWSDVESSRSNNTWYQNTTGRPMMLGIGMLTNKTLRVGSATNNYANVISTGGDPSEAMNEAIVPVNHYYWTNGKRTWSEMR